MCDHDRRGYPFQARHQAGECRARSALHDLPTLLGGSQSAASTAALRCSASLSGPTARCTSAVITAAGLARRRAAATAATAKKEMIFPPMSTVTPMACRVSARCVIYRDESRDSGSSVRMDAVAGSRARRASTPRLIYRADEVKKAIAEGRIIACAEGEKDADSLWSLGIAATCNAHGASEPGKQAKWTKAHSEQLAGADIVVFNDNDAAGYEHADATCNAVARHRQARAPARSREALAGDPKGWGCKRLARRRPHPRGARGADRDRAGLCSKRRTAAGESSEQGADGTDAEIERLAKLSAIQYEQERKGAASQLGVRAPILDRLVQAERERLGLVEDDGRQGRSISLPEPEPWPTPIDGAALLDGIAEAIGRYVVMSEHARYRRGAVGRSHLSCSTVSGLRRA